MKIRNRRQEEQAELSQQLRTLIESNKPREKDEMSMEIGKFLLDLSKLTFAGVFLTGITGLSIEKDYFIGLGAIIIILLALSGFKYIKIGINKKK